MSDEQADIIETTTAVDSAEAPAVEAQVTDAGEAQPSPEATATTQAGGLRLVAIVRKLDLGRLSLRNIGTGRLIAALLFLAVCASGIHFLRDELVVEVAAENANPLPNRESSPSDLEASELVRLGEGALQVNDVDSASRFLEEARIRAEGEHPDDVNLSVDIFEGLAQVAELRGRPRVAELYRDYIRRKQAELGESLPIFSAAEREFQAGNWSAARSGFARFLLTRATLGPAGARYVKRAQRRLAEIWQLDYQQQAGTAVSLIKLSEPEEFFNERR